MQSSEHISLWLCSTDFNCVLRRVCRWLSLFQRFGPHGPMEVRTVASFFCGLRLKRPTKRNCFEASRHGSENALGMLRRCFRMFSPQMRHLVLQLFGHAHTWSILIMIIALFGTQTFTPLGSHKLQLLEYMYRRQAALVGEDRSWEKALHSSSRIEISESWDEFIKTPFPSDAQKSVACLVWIEVGMGQPCNLPKLEKRKAS